MAFSFYAPRPLTDKESSPYAQAITNAIDTYTKGLNAYYTPKTLAANALYKQAMANYLMNPYQSQRFMTPLGKLLNEQAMRGGGTPQGGLPGHMTPQGFEGSMNGQVGEDYYSNPPNEPSIQRDDPYALELQKHTSDADTRKRNLFATNIEKTIQSVNPKDLTTYSGVRGEAEKYLDFLKGAITGHSPERLQQHLEAVTAAKTLAKQARQFYGDSISPTNLKELESLANPSSWKYDPETAQKLYNKYTSILSKESKTFRDALRNKDVYTRGAEQPNYDNLSSTQKELLDDADRFAKSEGINLKSQIQPTIDRQAAIAELMRRRSR